MCMRVGGWVQVEWVGGGGGGGSGGGEEGWGGGVSTGCHQQVHISTCNTPLAAHTTQTNANSPLGRPVTVGSVWSG
jgi:hypothetical protein